MSSFSVMFMCVTASVCYADLGIHVSGQGQHLI